MISLALAAGLHCTASADTWSVIAFVVADGNLQQAGETYCRRLVDVARDAGWSLALQLDNGTVSPTRTALRDGERVAVTESAAFTDATDPDGIADFLRWARGVAPAEHYVVVVFGHGVSASGRGWDGAAAARWPALALDATAGGAPLRPGVLASAMHEGLGRAADVIVLDCCYGASFEVAWELRTSADVVIASPGRAPSRGVRWEGVLAEPTGSAIDLARRLADANEHIVAISTRGLWQVAECVRSLSAIVIDQIDAMAPALSRARSEARTWGSEDEMCDLRALCASLADCSAAETAVAAKRAVAAVDACILSETRAVTVPWLPGMHPQDAEVRPAGFHEISRLGQMTRAYRDRHQYLMRRTFDDRRHDGGAT